MQILQQTYDKAQRYIGKRDDKGYILLPIAHSTQNAQIEMVIDLNGNLIRARKVEKSEAVTIIPVTENSGSRSSGIAPHPLFDKLIYIAGDYEEYFEKSNAKDYYEAYLKQLKQWVKADCHYYVKAVYLYIVKKQLLKDLIDENILQVTESKKLDETIKIEGVSQVEAFVRFRIQDENIQGLGEIWKEQEVYEDFTQYYLNLFNEKDLDYITGKDMPCSDKHPSKIRNSGDKSKLISANDTSGFTYRGRFINKDEAVSVGYLSSQKAHNALRWLIERQGYKQYGMCVVTWNPENEEVPDWLRDDTYDIAYDDDYFIPLELGETYAIQMNRAIKGKYAKLDEPSKQIVIMALDAATPGRLSVTYYQQLEGSVFLNNLIEWHTSCCWSMSYKKGVNYINLPMAPSPEDIAKAAYGTERNGYLQVDERIMEDTLKRLTPCIVAGRTIPKDLVKAAVGNASRPQAFNNYNRKKILDITCALIRKDYLDRNDNRKGAVFNMSLDKTNKNRDYLYGRLLAVAHKMEYDTFSEEEREKRMTNAERYRSMLIKNPNKTWIIIEEKIQPYKRKLKGGIQIEYQKKLQEIYDCFEGTDFYRQGKLGEQVLLGYHCQLSALWNKNNKEDKGISIGGEENE